MRFRAGKLHPNPAVHHMWWAQFLTKHRHDIKTLESPVKRYMMKESAKIPPKIQRNVFGGQSQQLTGRKSRPSSAGGRSTRASARPSSAPTQRRTQSVAPPTNSTSGQQWDPFRGIFDGPATASGKSIAPPGDAGRSIAVLRNVGDVFQNCLEDLDMVERDTIANQSNMALKRRFAMLKIQVADLSKQIDLIREDCEKVS